MFSQLFLLTLILLASCLDFSKEYSQILCHNRSIQRRLCHEKGSSFPSDMIIAGIKTISEYKFLMFFSHSNLIHPSSSRSHSSSLKLFNITIQQHESRFCFSSLPPIHQLFSIFSLVSTSGSQKNINDSFWHHRRRLFSLLNTYFLHSPPFSLTFYFSFRFFHLFSFSFKDERARMLK